MGFAPIKNLPEQFHKGYFTKSSMDTKSPFSCSASDIAAKVSSFGILISNGSPL
jgi:hypothetical protein